LRPQEAVSKFEIAVSDLTEKRAGLISGLTAFSGAGFKPADFEIDLSLTNYNLFFKY
jgi:hypothetical protein